MSNLVVTVFNDELRAHQAMCELVQLYKPRPDLDNALLLIWNGSDPIAQQSQNLADRCGSGWGLLWGSLLRAVVNESGQVEAAVLGLRNGVRPKQEKRPVNGVWQTRISISKDFFRDVAALITPGRSAIFFVSRSATLETVGKVAHGYGGTLLSVPLSKQQLAKIRKFVKANSTG